MAARRGAQAEGRVAADTADADADEEQCELVSGNELALGTGGDKFAAHLVQPRKNDTGTGVLLFSDILGHADNDTRDLAYRLSCHGYSVLVPDLFRGDPWDKSRSKDEQEGWRAQHTSKRVAADIDTSSAYLRDDVLQGGKMGLLGFCFGGGRAVETLARDDSRTFSAGAIFYGTRFDTMLGSQIRAPLLLITGDNDDLSPVNEVQKLATLVPGSQVQVYKGRGHAFAHHPGSVEEDEDAEDAFEAMRHWFHTHLLT
eukprot:SM000100S09383  [mRNA]  locus=s100:53545:55454:+ [translate_table: standard]